METPGFWEKSFFQLEKVEIVFYLGVFLTWLFADVFQWLDSTYETCLFQCLCPVCSLALSRNALHFLMKYIGVSEITWSQAFCLRYHQQNWTFSKRKNLPGWWQSKTGWHVEWAQRQMGYYLWKIRGKVMFFKAVVTL